MLSLATIRSRWHIFLGTFAALVVAVGLLGATGLVLHAAEPRVPARLAQADVLVRAAANPNIGSVEKMRRPWSQAEAGELATRIDALDGVSAAVPDTAFYLQALVNGRAAGNAADEPQGHGWSAAQLASFGLSAGRAPSVPGEVVLDDVLGAEPGERVTLLTAAGPRRYTVSGTVDGPGEYPSGYYVADDEAKRLAGGVTMIGVRAGADVAERISALVGEDAEVLAGDARTAAEPVRESRMRELSGQVLGMITGLAAFTSIFVVASTFAFGTHQRRREFALLRLVGALPRQVRRSVYAEALVVSATAGVAGSALAAASAQLFGDVLARAELVRPDLDVPVVVGPLAAAAGVGLVVALLGVWSACRRAAKVPPLEALQTAAVETRPMTWPRRIFGVLFLLIGAALASTVGLSGVAQALTNASIAAGAAVLGMALLAPALLPPMLRVVCWPLARLRGATGLLVREGSLTGVRRIASVTAPVLLTVSFAVLLVGTLTTALQATTLGEADEVGAGVAVTAVENGAGLSEAAAAAVPGNAVYAVESSVFHRDDTGHWSERNVSGVSPDVLAAAWDITVRSGDLTELVGDSFATTPDMLGAMGWRLGDSVPVRGPDGASLSLRLVAVVDGHELPGRMLLHEDTVRVHDPSALVPVVFTDAPRAEVAAAVGDLGAAATDMTTWAEDDGGQRELLWLVVTILVTISAGFGALSVGNTMLMAVRDRRGEFRLLRLAGATPRQVAGLVAAESVVVVGLGAALGGLVSGGALLVMRSALEEAAAEPVPLSVPWVTVAGVVGVCLLTALVLSVGPAYLAARRPVTS